jgi:carboxyl-terminal processing protease
MRYFSLVLVAVAGLLAGGVGLTFTMASAESGNRATFQELGLMGDILNRVKADYVTETDGPELVEAAIQGMLQSLDPHSSYMPPESFRDMQVQSSGEYGGLGIEVTTERGVVKVVSPIDDTPAQRAGIKPGDYITGINGKSIIGESLDDSIDKMRGPAGAPITLNIARKGVDETLAIEIVRAIITVRSVTWRVEGDNLGYIRVATFNENTDSLLDQAFTGLQKQLGDKLRGIILDLRNDPGGLLDQAIAVSDAFLDGGEVVSTRGRNPDDIERYNARRGSKIGNLPVVVLINGGSASASEIVAGALQDRKRATLIGTTSFGKGSVQTVIPLNGGRNGALRLTTARYYTPSGRSIQATGITPDIAIAAERSEKPAKRLSEADLPHALKNELESHEKEVAAKDGEATEKKQAKAEMPPKDYPEDKDFQLERAKQILGKMVLSGKLLANAG